MKHPTEETIIALALSRAERRSEESAAARHVADCPDCAARLREVERVLDAMAADRTLEPPVAWVERAIGAFTRRALAGRLRAWMRGLREETARLVQDPGLGWAAAGVRSVGTPRRVRFEIEDLELDLQIEPEGRGATLLGQVLRLGGEAAPVAYARLLATSGAGDFVETTTDALGEFSVSIAAESPLEVRVADGGRVVRFAIGDDSPTSG